VRRFESGVLRTLYVSSYRESPKDTLFHLLTPDSSHLTYPISQLAFAPSHLHHKPFPPSFPTTPFAPTLTTTHHSCNITR